MKKIIKDHFRPIGWTQGEQLDIPPPLPLWQPEPVAAPLCYQHRPLAWMLFDLQQGMQKCNAHWEQVEPVMDRLAELLAPAQASDTCPASGSQWWLELGQVDLTGRLVTIQRGDSLVAAIAARGDGRLRVTVFRPLDAKSAEYLIGLGQVPHPEHGVCGRENNWAYALDCSAGNGNHYAADRGEAYLSYWEKGLGLSWDGSEVPLWRKQLSLVARPAARVAVELGVYSTLSGNDNQEPVDDSRATGAIETPTLPTWRSKRPQKRTVRDRFKGCLLGGAVGDALGAPIEFMSRTEVLRRFGPKGITQYSLAYGALGTLTDDTQMALFTAEGLIRGWVRERFKGITNYSGVAAHAYLRWLLTQGEQPTCDLDLREPGWLFQQPELHNRRAPGNTCLSALRAMNFWGEPARNDSKGCGGVMRVAPVGLFVWRLRQPDELQNAFHLGTELSALTHGHPTGSLPGGVLAALILALMDGASLPEALSAAKTLLRMEADHEETLLAIEKAEQLATTTLPHHEAIAQLGQGWIAEEALAIAIYCALVARNFKHGVILAVNHDGDSDSTGAIVGNILGAIHGEKAIPTEWLEPLELRNVITELAEDLYGFVDWDIGEFSPNEVLNEQILRKYPGV